MSITNIKFQSNKRLCSTNMWDFGHLIYGIVYLEGVGWAMQTNKYPLSIHGTKKDGISFIIYKLFWSKEWMMQTHNILTELNEARCPGQLRCWSQDWPGPGLHLDDSEHSDNLRSSGGGITLLSWNQTACGESVSKDWIIWMTNNRKSRLSLSIPLFPFIITISCTQPRYERLWWVHTEWSVGWADLYTAE